MASGTRRGGVWRWVRSLIVAVMVSLVVACASALLLGPQLATVATGTAFGTTWPQSPFTGFYAGLTVESVHVTRSDESSSFMPPFDKTVTDARAAQALYNAAFALPAYPSGIINCPLGADITYHLRFARRGLPAPEMTVNGCFKVSLSWLGDRLWDSSFDYTFASALGVSETSLWNYPQA